MSSDVQATVAQQQQAGTPPAQPQATSDTLSAFRVYKPPQTADNTAPAELPESYFTPTTADLKAAQASLSARTQALSNAPLRTQAMRDAELKAKLARWPTTTIRVRFPDRTQLERSFPSTDKIRSVYAFVRGSLREDVKPIKFVLYQTPPKRELRVSDPQVRDQTLFQLQLTPSSVLHLKFEDESLNHMTVAAPLDASVWEKAEDLPLNPTSDQPSTAKPPASPTSKPAGSSTGSSTGKSTTKVPKWFKMGANK